MLVYQRIFLQFLILPMEFKLLVVNMWVPSLRFAFASEESQVLRLAGFTEDIWEGVQPNGMRLSEVLVKLWERLPI